jgi:VWFA-related protein
MNPLPKSIFFNFLGIAVLTGIIGAEIIFSPGRQLAQNKSQDTSSLRVETQEILLDMVVRDKKGRFVLDLKPEEVTVFEDGVQQKITGFRLMDRGALPAPPEGGGATPPDPFRHINLVTLVFERVGGDPEPRKLAREAALQFLDSELRDNVYVAVFVFDRRLQLLQSFTNDRKLLREAVEAANSGSFNEFMVKSEARDRAIEEAVATQAAADMASAAVGQTPAGQAPDTSTMGATMMAAQIAAVAKEILLYSESIEREQQSAASMASLLALVRGQEKLAGRKTVIYFSQGLIVTSNQDALFRLMIGRANQAHVSFYTVDTTGLNSVDKMLAARKALTEAANSSMSQTTRSGGTISMEEVRSGERGENSIHSNTQETLSALATQTGGQLIANSNDMRPFMSRVSDDIRHYYEVTYAPASPKYDGKFREISVKLSRPKVSVQARNGYFALPPVSTGPILQSFEIPVMSALNATPPPHDIDFRVQTLQFSREAEGVRLAIAMEAPLANITFRIDEKDQSYHSQLSFVGIIKNSDGQVVKKVSRSFPLSGDMKKLEELKKENASFLQDLFLPAGRYSLETAVLDRFSNKAGVRRSLLSVRAPRPGLNMSSLAVVKRVERIAANTRDLGNPLHTANTKVVINLGDPVPAGPGLKLSFYFIAYPAGDLLEEPQLRLQILQNGLVVSDSSLKLPSANEAGQIPFIASLPTDQFQPGEYEARAIVWQGNQTVEEHAFFKMEEKK